MIFYHLGTIYKIQNPYIGIKLLAFFFKLMLLPSMPNYKTRWIVLSMHLTLHCSFSLLGYVVPLIDCEQEQAL